MEYKYIIQCLHSLGDLTGEAPVIVQSSLRIRDRLLRRAEHGEVAGRVGDSDGGQVDRAGHLGEPAVAGDREVERGQQRLAARGGDVGGRARQQDPRLPLRRAGSR